VVDINDVTVSNCLKCLHFTMHLLFFVHSVCIISTSRKVYCGKMAEWIQISFGMASEVGRGIGVLDGGGYRRRGMSSFGGEFEASLCNHCVEVHAAIELLLGR